MFHFFINYFTCGDFAHDLFNGIRGDERRIRPLCIIDWESMRARKISNSEYVKETKAAAVNEVPDPVSHMSCGSGRQCSGEGV